MNQFQKLKMAIESKRRPGGLAEIRWRFAEFESVYTVPMSQVLQLFGLWVVFVVRVWGGV